MPCLLHPTAHCIPSKYLKSIFSAPCSLRDLNPAQRQLSAKFKVGGIQGHPEMMCSLLVWTIFDQHRE